MRQPRMEVNVGPEETTAELLTQLNNVPPGTQILLRIPRDAKALRELDDFNNLRRVAGSQQLQLLVSSPEKTIVGLARLLGFEVDSKPAGPGAPPDPVRPPAPAAAPATRRADTRVMPAPANTAVAPIPPPPAAPTRSRTDYEAALPPAMSMAAPAPPARTPAPPTPPARTPTPPAPMAAPPMPAPPMASAPSSMPAAPISENDWLFADGMVPDDHVEAPGGNALRQPTPPPDVHIVGGPATSAVARPTPPSDVPDDIDSMNFDDADLERQSAQWRDEIAANTAARAAERPADGGAPPADARPAGGGAVGAARPATGGPLGLGRLLGGNKPASTPSARPQATTNGRTAPAPTSRTARPTAPPARLDEAAPIYAEAAPAALSSAAVAAPAVAASAVASPARNAVARPRPAASPLAPRGATRTQTRRNNLWLLLPLALLIVLFIALPVWVASVFSQATVDVAPTQQARSFVVEVPVNTTGAGLTRVGGLEAPIAASRADQVAATGILTAAQVPAQRFTGTLNANESMPTTGSRDQAAGTDKITLALVNPNQAAAVLYAGNQVRSGSGVAFQLERNVTVPAASDTGTSLVYGQASVDADATELGPHTVGVGAVAGSFNNGIRFHNTTSASGGYIEKIATVAQADVDKLRSDLLAKLQPQVNGAILQQVPADMKPILPSLSVPDGNWKETVDHVVGEDATQVAMTTTVTGSVAAYKPVDMDQAVATVVQASMKPSDPVAVSLAGPIQHGPLEPSGSASGDQILYRTVTTATVQYGLTDEMREAIKEAVSGKSLDEAKQALQASWVAPYIHIDSVQITSGFMSFNQDKVPSDLSRVSVNLRGADTTPSTP